MTPQRPSRVRGWRVRPRLPHSLRARLTTGLVALLALACVIVGLVTVLGLRSFLVSRLDQQIVASGGRFAVSLEHEGRPDADGRGDTRGQADGTLGARLLRGRIAQAAVVRGTSDVTVPLTADDARALAAVPADARPRTVRLASLGTYRVAAWSGDDGDVLLSGLPLHPVEETVERLAVVETVVFAIVLTAAGVITAAWTRFSLRSLERLAVTADEVTRLPLAAGQVAMPPPLPGTRPDTEVGRLTGAFNRMLGHVGDALDRRHVVEERLRTFAADAGHELRTPVATVRARAELALRHHGDTLPDEVRHALERIDAESRRMSLLVDELLLLARLDAGRSLRRDAVDLTRIVLDTVADATARHPRHLWELDLPEEPVHVTGDGDRLHQVLGNLLANAGGHTPPGTRVTVGLAADAERVTLTVTDDGPGIPAELLPGVFHRFTRGDSSRSRATGSTGLGLAIVDAVTRAHDGRATVTSRPGHTRFTLRLPARRDDDGTSGGEA
ncbi:sensor histidine kinase [Streptomyces nymphaeiformis]|uniref:histidine kinase n=1 Tax=Streptomyces nymphaeiformis TaxID=2663842 RepID=A0A7W7U3G7_9ACTN|nr:ATP-binding protein [Streptomyces nymphaeiformis]MBB4984291.1 two-component system OmpR family sensor kinase [Streptomyces nymphaeiformis]